MLEFRLLGSLEVLADGRAIAVRAGKQRAALAVLLLHANDVVSIDAFADALWGEQPPPTAAAAIQNSLGQQRIETRAPGYRLRVEPDEVDALRFERLVQEALASGEPIRRAAM